MPKISLLTPCFNHEKYILKFLESVKAQTLSDFEVVIVDDCSTDNTTKIIENFGDNRIKLIKHEYNKGINSVINTAFKYSDSPLCVLVSSDDELKPNTLEYLVNKFENNPDKSVLYCSLSTINENGKDLHKTLKPKVKDKFEILRKIFYSSNPLLSPAMTIRRSSFEKIYPLIPSIVNHQDSLMHVKLLLDNEIMVSDKELAYYRIPSQKSGISIRSIATENRENLEINTLLDSFLGITDTNLLYQIFGNNIEKYGKPIKETIPYFLARLALNSDNQTRKIWGYNTIVKFLDNQENFNLVHNLYGFNYKEFLGLVNTFSETEEMKLNKKVKKYKNLFNTTLLISILTFIIMLIFIVK